LLVPQADSVYFRGTDEIVEIPQQMSPLGGSSWKHDRRAHGDGGCLIEFNVSLIQRELNHERIDSHGTGTFGSRRKTIGPAEEKNSKGIPENSGAAVRPHPGIQRFSQLAGRLRA